MIRTRLASVTLAAGLGLVCGCSSDFSFRNMFSHHNNGTMAGAPCCVTGECPCDGGGLPMEGLPIDSGPVLPPAPVAPFPVTPVPVVPGDGIPPVSPPPRVFPTPAARTTPYVPH
jgi:hypothetical protein